MQCPVCRTELERGPQCTRCRADLSLLFTLEDQRQAMLATAYEALRRGDWDSALDRGRQCQSIRRDDAARRVVCLAHLLAGRLPDAFREYMGSAMTIISAASPPPVGGAAGA